MVSGNVDGLPDGLVDGEIALHTAGVRLHLGRPIDPGSAGSNFCGDLCGRLNRSLLPDPFS